MKKTKGLLLTVMVFSLLTGCSKFSPKETAVSVGKDGAVTAAVIDKLDQSYYDAEELKASVESSVADYNGDAGEDTITVEKLEIGEEGDVELFMKYASYKDYADFNNVDFYVGDITDGYNNGGYRFETGFYQVEKGEITGEEIQREEIFAGANHPMLVFSEDMAVEVPGKILYVSSNVEVTGKKSARMAGSSQKSEDETETETVFQSESSEESQTENSEDGQDEGDIQEVTPTVELIRSSDSNTALAYIIYE